MGESGSHSAALRRTHEKQNLLKKNKATSRALRSFALRGEVPEEDKGVVSDAESEISSEELDEREQEEAVDVEEDEEWDAEDGGPHEEEEEKSEEEEEENDEEEDEDEEEEGEDRSESADEREEAVKKSAGGAIPVFTSSSNRNSSSTAKKSRFLFVSAEQSAESRQRRAEHIQRQRQLLSGLLSLRIRMNPVLRIVGRLPSPGALSLLQQLPLTAEEQPQQQEQQSAGEGPDAGLDGARREAAGLLVECLSLQRLVLQQSSLKHAAAAAAGTAAEASNSEGEGAEGRTTTNSEVMRSASWEGRRSRWWFRQQQQQQAQQEQKQQQQEEEQRQQEATEKRGKKRQAEVTRTVRAGPRSGDSDEDDATKCSSVSSCGEGLSSSGVLLLRGNESEIWQDVVDACWRKRARQRCLETADAWQAALDPQTQVFKVLKQPLSVQLSHAMTSQYERLLRRAVRTSHLLPAAPAGSAAGGAAGATGGCCEVVACETLQRLCCRLQQQMQQEQQTQQQQTQEEGERRPAGLSSSGGGGVVAAPLTADMQQHELYEDLDFYVELLKEVVKQGSGAELLQEDSSSPEGLDRAKSLLKLRNKLNRRRVDVDRRASKGKKLRYQVIPKLQNFLTAVPWEPDTAALPGAAAAGAGPGETCPIVDRLMRQLFAD